MGELSEYVNDFFNQLEVFEDISRGHNYKTFIHQAILEFLRNETKQNALAVYEAFFDGYRILLPGDTNPFIDLLDVLQNYEENAATLIDKQRDHFIHSVNVFILGLCIYSQNASYQTAFNAKNLDKEEYAYFYPTANEEFFYRWGIASMFHDVGYPLEIIGKQITKFMDFATNIDGEVVINSHLQIDNFEELNKISEVIPRDQFIKSYFEKYDSCVSLDLLKPLDLLAHKLHLSLNINLLQTKTALDNFIEIMTKNGFIDHGFFSAIIVLRWYGFLIQMCKYKSEYFFYPVVDSASAILLHNYYKNVLMKPPFNKGCLYINEHPVAWLLILCDELQEWNREAYGIQDKKCVHTEKASLSIKDDRIDIIYFTGGTELPPRFSADKVNLIKKLLDMGSVFTGGFTMQCKVTNGSFSTDTDLGPDINITPRPLIENLEKIAIAIHDLYNQKQVEQYPDKPLDYPRYSDLPGALKYSNLRQARSIANKIKLAGWEIRPKGASGDVISEIPENILELLAMNEHEDWIYERRSNGYVYGSDKDNENKVSPYLIPYEALSEEIKEFDRLAIRNIPTLLDRVGLAIYKKQ